MRDTLLFIQRHGVAEILGIVCNASAVKADELWVLYELFHLVQLALGEENAKVSNVIMLCLARILGHGSSS